MKVRVSYTVEVNDFYRQEIRKFYGQEGLATRDEVKQWLREYGSSMDDDLAAQAQVREQYEQDMREAAEDSPIETVPDPPNPIERLAIDLDDLPDFSSDS